MTIKVTSQEIEAYQRDGYIVVEDLVTDDELERLRSRLRNYTHGGRNSESLRIQVEPRVQRGELQVDHPGDGIRKIDGLVEGDDRFRKLGLHPNILAIITQLLGPDIKLYRNSLLLKPPAVGSAKGMHQDSPYWPIEPMDLCSCWFPLDAATLENGCMAVMPGGHKRGALPHVEVQDDYVIDEAYYQADQMITVPMRAGSGLFFHSLLPHYTAPNRSKNWRRAIALSYMSARSRYTHDGAGPVYFHVQGKTYPGCVR